jgi:hypothetical protein
MKGGTGMRMLSICLTALFVAAAVHADDYLSGKIDAIDAEKGTLVVSGVTIMAQDAGVKGLVMCSKLSRLKTGNKVGVTGRFTGPLQMRADRVKKIFFANYEIFATLDKIDAKAGILQLSGITVMVPEGAWIEDAQGTRTTMDTLAKGQRLEVDGNWTAPCELTASRVEIKKE